MTAKRKLGAFGNEVTNGIMWEQLVSTRVRKIPVSGTILGAQAKQDWIMRALSQEVKRLKREADH
jgi:hypothetical protein